MKSRELAIAIGQRVARLSSFAVSLLGVWAFVIADFRRAEPAMALFCVLPVASFAITAVGCRRLGWATALHWASAIAYFCAYAYLDWQTCAGPGYCVSVPWVLGVTLTAWRVEAMVFVALASSALLFLRGKSAKSF